MKKWMTVAALSLVAACGEEQGAGGVTAEESAQLNNAAEMLDATDTAAVPADETGLANPGAGAQAGDLPVADETATNEQ